MHRRAMHGKGGVEGAGEGLCSYTADATTH